MNDFLFGVVEGFYGRPWSWSAREAWLDFLVQRGFNCYVYAPKTDRHLRDNWHCDWPEDDFQKLRAHASRARKLGLRWGVGFSPLGIHPRQCEDALPERLAQIRRLQADVFWLLFDDQEAGDDAVAMQVDIARYCRECLGPEVRMALCPTWYSFDEKLQSRYGEMPADYLHELGRLLPREIDILWTGQQVCSPTQPLSHYREMKRIFRRAPLLWDNYPVNDGVSTRDFLHMASFNGRSWRLGELCAGHMANPMNQAWLSMPPLATLAELYAAADAYDPDTAWRNALEACGDTVPAELLRRDAKLFLERGRKGMGVKQLEALKKDYAACEQPGAAEVLGWLNGDYVAGGADHPT